MMPITSSNLASHELVSLPVMVSSSPDPSQRGLVGIVRDETRNIILVEAKGRLLGIPKIGSSFTFHLSTGESANVEGSRLRFRPEDRVKRGLPKW